MNPFDISPEQLADELKEFNRKLTDGFETLTKLEKIEVGVSPRECIYEKDKLKLYRYKPRVEKRNAIPVLIVYALVNRPYMTDLQEGRSLIQGLLDQGLDIYLIDWGYPDEQDVHLKLEDYILDYLSQCVDFVCDSRKLEKINLLGICQGGVFSLCYTALDQSKIANLITTVTPVDFHTKNDLLSNLARNIDFDLLANGFGNIPGAFLNWLFLSLKPYRLMSQKYMDLVDILEDEEKAANFMRMEKWIFDSPDQAGDAFCAFVKMFYQENGLIKGKVKLAGKVVDLENITIPVLNIYARDDHLVPPDSSKALAGCVSSEDYTDMEFPGGHIGLYVSAKSQTMLVPEISNWIREKGR